MITAILPATNHKPDWVELRVDGAHTANIWAHDVEVNLNKTVHRFMLAIHDANGAPDAFLWVDAIQPRQEKSDGR
jgi:hypothetical protein